MAILGPVTLTHHMDIRIFSTLSLQDLDMHMGRGAIVRALVVTPARVESLSVTVPAARAAGIIRTKVWVLREPHLHALPPPRMVHRLA